MSNLLFICSKNQWRSPTAELLFKNHQFHNARSAGTSNKARIKVNQKLIEGADIIFVMEPKHKKILNQQFSTALSGKLIVVLDIEDNYRFNDPELVEILEASLGEYIGEDLPGLIRSYLSFKGLIEGLAV